MRTRLKRVKFYAGRRRELEYDQNMYMLAVYWDPDPHPEVGQRAHRRHVELTVRNPFYRLSYSLK